MRLIKLVISIAFMLSPIPQAQAFLKCMPLYGNWCGVDYPPKGTFPPPVDEFDAACMRHDLCTAGDDFLGNTRCDRMFVSELNALRLKYGFLPKPLQWAEYALRVKSGGPWGGMPMPTPWDMLGFAQSVLTPCW
ncbi:MAG TPA: hypothetical protein ENK62_06410 [Chromatiales bacterium]|nr:hypothetical protein [Chromatiales bacterium]